MNRLAAVLLASVSVPVAAYAQQPAPPPGSTPFVPALAGQPGVSAGLPPPPQLGQPPTPPQFGQAPTPPQFARPSQPVTMSGGLINAANAAPVNPLPGGPPGFRSPGSRS